MEREFSLLNNPENPKRKCKACGKNLGHENYCENQLCEMFMVRVEKEEDDEEENENKHQKMK